MKTLLYLIYVPLSVLVVVAVAAVFYLEAIDLPVETRPDKEPQYFHTIEVHDVRWGEVTGYNDKWVQKFRPSTGFGNSRLGAIIIQEDAVPDAMCAEYVYHMRPSGYPLASNLACGLA